MKIDWSALDSTVTPDLLNLSVKAAGCRNTFNNCVPN
jgi:hypothetical protein